MTRAAMSLLQAKRLLRQGQNSDKHRDPNFERRK